MSPWFYSHVKTLAVAVLTVSALFFTPTLSIAGQATLAWDPNDPVPEGYRIYQRADGQAYDYSQPVWTGSGTTGTVYNLDYGTTYYFVVRAYAGDLESADSEEVSYHSPVAQTTTYSIATTSGDHGSISPSGVSDYTDGSDQTFTIKPDGGCHVVDVLVDGISQGVVTSYTFNQIDADHAIEAVFAVNTYQISVSAGSNGRVSPSGTTNVAHGESLNYTITPDAGYHIANVAVDGTSVGAVSSYIFNEINSNHTITAAFEADAFVITVAAGENGSVSPNGALDATRGSSRTIVFNATSGFHVADVLVDGQSVGVVDSYTFSDVCADHSLEVFFAENTDVEIWIEAEDGDLQWPMEIGDDAAAGAGGFIWVPVGIGNLSSSVEGSGFAEYRIEIPEAGDYVIWARQISNDGASDSFFFSIDGMEEMVWHTKQGGQDVWRWDVFAIRDASNPDYAADPMVLRLSAGAHTVRISQREDGTKLDQIVVTNQLDKVMAESNVVADLMEYGEVEVNHNWVQVNFEKTFVNPVVVAGPISLNGSAPAVVRIRNIDIVGFEMRIQEWDYLDGSHATEMVSYLVMEQGHYTLEDGTIIEAGVVETNADDAFERIAFGASFNVVPVVLSSLITYNGSDAVTSRMKNVSLDGFEYRMQEQEANAQRHAAEMADYIVWEPSSGVLGDVSYAVGKTANAVKHKLYNIGFDAPFDAPPVFLGNMQTTDGGDTANVRYTGKTGFSVDVLIDEEKSKNTETNHTSEEVGYMVLAR